MTSMIEKEYIICGKCNFKFNRIKENKHCSNCIVCTGCEIYYCKKCDEEIVVTPIKPIYFEEGVKRRGGDWENRRLKDI
jgi:hypothetical protein